MEEWFKEVKDGSHRDQLSFNYASWKHKDVKIIYMDKTICKSEWFFWHGVHRKVRPILTAFKSLKRNPSSTVKPVPMQSVTRRRVISGKVDTQNIGIYRV
jgi:hypothetical protein